MGPLVEKSEVEATETVLSDFTILILVLIGFLRSTSYENRSVLIFITRLRFSNGIQGDTTTLLARSRPISVRWGFPNQPDRQKSFMKLSPTPFSPPLNGTTWAQPEHGQRVRLAQPNGKVRIRGA